MGMEDSEPPVPAATVVLARESARSGSGQQQIEVLLLRRNAKLVFHGGHWVFPGGRIDEADFVDEARLEYPAAVQAAVRETREEAGIELLPEHLIHTAHWTTPPNLPRRFSTWFFLYPLYEASREAARVTVDNDEILDFRWLSPDQALSEAKQQKIVLPRPTQTTLRDMLGFRHLDELVAAASAGEIRVFPENSEHYRPDEMGYNQASK
jgi:8-oxo-dGTP pyrophosphatase MutT (NUDIX family)